MKPPDKIQFLYVNIGRGHPFYLDGIVEVLTARGVGSAQVAITDVRMVCPRWVRLVWNAMEWLYRRGGSRGPTGWLYSLARKGADVGGQGFSGSVLRRAYRGTPHISGDTVVISHPILLGVLPDKYRVIYQHGELVAPKSALAAGASEVIVPTEAVADLFVQAGYSREQIFVSGLCIEPGAVKVADDAYRKRRDRLDQSVPLTGLFVSSGAEPYQHIRHLISSITSCQSVGMRTFVLTRKGGRLDSEVRRMGRKIGIEVIDLMNPGPRAPEPGDCAIIACTSTLEESQAMTFLTPQIDFFVGPPHERTNWALGLGLPMFALTPCIGPFAPLNLKLLESSGTTLALGSNRDAEFLGETVTELRRAGKLARMAECGWGKYRIDGFERIAEHLLKSA